MKLFIVLAVFVCCAYADPLKSKLLQRAEDLDHKIKTEIKELQVEKREHLALVLEEEEKRLETLAAELKKTADTDAVQTALLENELITMEFRVENEVSNLQREVTTQELLEANAKILMQWVTEEIKLLEKTEGKHKKKAEKVARTLRSEEQTLARVAEQLTKAQSQKAIESLEVELRAIEIRLYEALRELHFVPTTASPEPVTTPTQGSARPTSARPTARPSTARPETARPSTARPETARPSTARPETVRPSTARPETVRPSTARPSTARPSTARPAPTTASRPAPITSRTTLSPLVIKDMLLKRAAVLELNVKTEITKLQHQNRTTQAKYLQTLESEVKRISDILKKTTQVEILQLLESELFWLESRLFIEIQALQAQEKKWLHSWQLPVVLKRELPLL